MEEKHILGLPKESGYDNILQQRFFEVFISPSNSNHNYGEIEINALNTVWDLLLDRPYNTKGILFLTGTYQELKTAVHIEAHINKPTE